MPQDDPDTDPPADGDQTSQPGANAPPPVDKSKGGNKEDEEAKLARELKEAQDLVVTRDTALTALRERKKAASEAEALIKDYEKELPALRDGEKGLEQFRLAEIEFAEEMLPGAVRAKIDKVQADLEAEIAPTRARLAAAEAELRGEQTGLDNEKRRKSEAEAALKTLTAFGGAIRERLKRAEAVRSETNKAEDGRDYALAYWLVMEDGRLDAEVHGKPAIAEPGALRDAIVDERAKLAGAQAAITTGEAKVKKLGEEIKAKQAEVAAFDKVADKEARKRVSALNPKTS